MWKTTGEELFPDNVNMMSQILKDDKTYSTWLKEHMIFSTRMGIRG